MKGKRVMNTLSTGGDTKDSTPEEEGEEEEEEEVEAEDKEKEEKKVKRRLKELRRRGLIACRRLSVIWNHTQL